MNPFRYTLVPDGPSDRALIPIINWVLSGTSLTAGISEQVADFRHLADPPPTLVGRIRRALLEYPCDLLFVHRDAEGERREVRTEEIRMATEAAPVPRWVPVVPVRMTEAWLLIDDGAIRRSADNPNGTMRLPLPRVTTLEAVPDPKRVLHECLLTACDLGQRRRQQFQRSMSKRVQRVAFLIEDFSPLDLLPAFHAFRESTHMAVEAILALHSGSSPRSRA